MYNDRYQREQFYTAHTNSTSRIYKIFYYNNGFFDNILFEKNNIPTKNINTQDKHNILKINTLENLQK